MRGLDEQRSFRIIVKRVAQLTNSDLEDCVANKSLRPDGGEKFFFGNELTRMSHELVEHRVSLRPELDYFRASPQTLIGTVQAKGLEDYAGFIAQVTLELCRLFFLLIMTRKTRKTKVTRVTNFVAGVTETLPHIYAKFMTCKSASPILRKPDV